MKSNLLVKFAAFAALLGAAASAHAAGITIGTGDLILGFQDSSSSNSIQFKLGNIAPVLNTANGAVTDLGVNVNTALSWTGSGTTGYGASWASTSSIAWTVVGKDASNFYGSMGQTAPASTLAGGPATPNSVLATGNNTALAQSSLGTMISGMGTLGTGSQLKAGGTAILAAKYANSSGSSINAIDKAGTTNTAFSAFSSALNMNAKVTDTTTGTVGALNGLTYSAVDLYQFTGSAATYSAQFLGTIALTSGGELFYVAAIPEPSTYAAILGVATLGFAAIRRRKQQVDAQV